MVVRRSQGQDLSLKPFSSTSPAIYSSYQSYWSSALGLSDLKIWIEMETKLEREKKERETENWKS